MDFTSLHFSGRLVDDPEMKQGSSGTPICRFTVASNKRISGGEKTSFIPVVVLGRTAELCGEYLSKGREVRVLGEMETDSYTDREGIARKGFSCVVGVSGVVEFGKGGRKAGEDQEEPSTRVAKATAAAGREMRNTIFKGKRPTPRKR